MAAKASKIDAYVWRRVLKVVVCDCACVFCMRACGDDFASHGFLSVQTIKHRELLNVQVSSRFMVRVSAAGAYERHLSCTTPTNCCSVTE